MRAFFCPAERGNDEHPGRQGGRHEPPQGKEKRAMNEVSLDPRQAPDRAELLLAADFGRQARGRPIHGRLENEDGGAVEATTVTTPS